MKWISVLNKLPGDECEVLSYTKKGYISVDYYDIDFETWDSDGNVTHWMPLPEPPKEK